MTDQLILGIRLQDEANFDNYLAADNEEVVVTLKDSIACCEWSCIYLAGNKGVGKSHLLQACCHYASGLGVNAFYLPIDPDLSPAILEGLDTFSLICVDNIDVIAGDRKWEESIFHFFNQLLQTDSRLIFAGVGLPLQLPFQLRDLSSRLASGPTYVLKPLMDIQKVQALQLRARIRGFELSDEVGHYLLTHYPRAMNELFELFELLDRASLQAQHKITIPFIKTVLAIS